MRNAVIFIDGQNFHFALQNIGLQEKDIIWEEFFKYIMPPQHSLVRAYWYQPQRVAPFDLFPADLERFCPATMSVDEYRKDRENWLVAQRERLHHIQNSIYRRVQEENPFVQFQYAGMLKINPYTEHFEERGVDVAIGVDMVHKVNGYDTAIILSGDVDLVPAVKCVKDNLKLVYGLVITSTVEQGGPRYFGYSRELMIAVDKVIYISEDEIKDPKMEILKWSQ